MEGSGPEGGLAPAMLPYNVCQRIGAGPGGWWFEEWNARRKRTQDEGTRWRRR